MSRQVGLLTRHMSLRSHNCWHQQLLLEMILTLRLHPLEDW